MRLNITILDYVSVEFDDEITDERPTPEVVEDYVTRLRQQAIDTWSALPDRTP